MHTHTHTIATDTKLPGVLTTKPDSGESIAYLNTIKGLKYLIAFTPRTEMSQFKGDTLTFKRKGETVKVQWKQGSFLGWGGDQIQTYWLCTYTLPSGSEAPVYIQTGYDVPKKMKIDRRLQYGMQDGVIFFVYHDKSQRPFQHRFRATSLQKFAYGVNEVMKFTNGIDLSFLCGEYLHDI